MRLQPTTMLGIFIGTTRCHRTGPAGWPCPHISNCYHGELSPYLLNAPVVTLSLAVLLVFIEPESAEDFRVFTQTYRIVNTRRFRGISSRICYRTGHAAESRSSRNSSHFKLSVTFPVSELAHRIKRGRRLPRDLRISTGILISRYLDVCQGFTGEHSSHSLAHQC